MGNSNIGKINWFNAPPVPAEVSLLQSRNLPLGGEIIHGPYGQQTFVSDRRESRQQHELPVSYAPGRGVYATAK